MKGFVPLFLGILGTFAFSWAGLVFVPNLQIGHLDPQTDEDGNDAYPAPKSGMVERGRRVYVANGCVYCHSQQVRADYAASDIDRKWGERRSAPRDYIFDRPVLLGKMRMGPDLANIGHRAPVTDGNAPPAAATSTTSGVPGAATSPQSAPSTSPAPNASAAPTISPAPSSATTSASPATLQNPTPALSPAPANAVTTVVNGAPLPYSAAWHFRHLYNPRGVTMDSNMPSYRFLFTEQKVAGEVSADALGFTDDSEQAVPVGWEIVPTYDAKCLVAYLMSLDQSHPLKEAKASTSLSPSAPGKEVK